MFPTILILFQCQFCLVKSLSYYTIIHSPFLFEPILRIIFFDAMLCIALLTVDSEQPRAFAISALVIPGSDLIS